MNQRARAQLFAFMVLSACGRPPLQTALVVRNLDSKCALIAFSGCASLVPPPEQDADAGPEDAP